MSGHSCDAYSEDTDSEGGLSSLDDEEHLLQSSHWSPRSRPYGPYCPSDTEDLSEDEASLSTPQQSSPLSRLASSVSSTQRGLLHKSQQQGFSYSSQEGSSYSGFQSQMSSSHTNPMADSISPNTSGESRSNAATRADATSTSSSSDTPDNSTITSESRSNAATHAIATSTSSSSDTPDNSTIASAPPVPQGGRVTRSRAAALQVSCYG